MNSIDKIAYAEVLTILKCMKIEYQQKIPQKLKNFFERNMAKDYKFNIDINKPLKEQKISDKAIHILAVLNLNYWCENEEEKQELLKLYMENDKKYNEKLHEKYNVEDMFKKHKKKESIQNNIMIPKDKQSILVKILNKIKVIFKH